MPNYVAGEGPLNPRLLICGEAPGKYEDESGRPFVGPTGELLNDLLFKAGISRSECYITNVVKYRPPFNDFEKLHLIGVDLEQSVNELWENEIKVFNPNCILAVGDRALNAICGLSGILNYRGSILTAKNGRTKCVPTIHPAALFGTDETTGNSNPYKKGLEWTWIKLIEADIRRAGEESSSPNLSLPDRTLSIAHNSLDVHRFFTEYASLDKAVTDIESINCVPVCIGFAFNKHHAISIPLLSNIGNVPLTDMGNNELNEVWREVDRQLRRLKLIGHNLFYDEYKLRLIGFQCPNIYSDTLIKARVIFPEMPKKRLNDLSSYWTREPFYKEEGKTFKLGKSKVEQLLLYNGRDCAVNYEVDEAMEEDLLGLATDYNIPLVDYYYKYQMRKHKFYLNMSMTGLPVDLARQKELKLTYTAMRNTVHKRLVDIIGQEVNVSSHPQMFSLLYKIMKFKVPKKAPTAEDAIVRHIGNHCKGGKTKYKPILEDILEEKRIKSQLSKSINFSVDYDGRCRSLFNVISTETTRSSTGVLKAPFRPKGKITIGLGFHTIPKHGRLAKDMRSMLLIDKGYVAVKIDASQAEPRVVAVLGKDWELLKAFDEKVDIHRRTAGLLFGYSDKLRLDKEYKNEAIDTMEKDSPERFTGKTVRNAGNYDTRKGTLMETFNTNAQKFEINMTISEWKAGQMLDLFHDASPRIKDTFHAEIQEAINSSRVLIDPYGGIRIFNGKLDEGTYREAYANIPQRTVAHLVQTAALDTEEELNGDLPAHHLWYSEDHDALTLAAPESNWEPYARLLKRLIERPIDFNTYCTLKRDYKLVIPGEVEMSTTNYGSFEKVKL